MSKGARSRLMASIHAKNTAPELRVRRYLHAAGLRYRLHERSLPGRPDLVFSKRKVAVFVNGCFWHRHEGCRLATQPASNVGFWSAKFDANVARDARSQTALRNLGWTPIIVWECQTKVLDELDRLFWQIIAVSA